MSHVQGSLPGCWQPVDRPGPSQPSVWLLGSINKRVGGSAPAQGLRPEAPLSAASVGARLPVGG